MATIPLTQAVGGAAGTTWTTLSADITFALANANSGWIHPSADTTARVWTIPANSAVAFPIGTFLDVVNQFGAGALTIAITTDTLRQAGNSTVGAFNVGANGKVRLLKVSATEWLAMDAVGLLSAFSMPSLFPASEVGFWWDPSDLTTMFQDALGTTPVTATGQSVGLLLDKKKGSVTLGNEILLNGTFTGNATSWTLGVNGGGTVTYNNNAVVFTNALQGQAVQDSLTLTAGKLYKITFTISAFSSGFITPQFINGGGAAVVGTQRSSAGTFTDYLRATGNASLRLLGSAGSANFTLDDISIKEVVGHHLQQDTTSKKPILRTDGGGNYYLEFDGVDDHMMLGTTTELQTPDKTIIFGLQPVSAPAADFKIIFGSGQSDWYVAGMGGAQMYSSHVNAAAAQRGISNSGSGVFASTTSKVHSWTWTVAGSNVTVLARANKANQTSQTAMPLTDGYTASTPSQAYAYGDYGLNGGLPFVAHRLYGAVMKAAMTTTERGNAESFLGTKMGLSI